MTARAASLLSPDLSFRNTDSDDIAATRVLEVACEDVWQWKRCRPDDALDIELLAAVLREPVTNVSPDHTVLALDVRVERLPREQRQERLADGLWHSALRQ